VKVYIAGTFTAQARLRPMADALRSQGHDIVSSWLYEPQPHPPHLAFGALHEALADKCIAEVFSAECIILDRFGESTSGGRYVEWGVACHPRELKLRYTVGPGPDLVFAHKRHRHFENWDDVLSYFTINHSARS
jgi:hypothetical protein